MYTINISAYVRRAYICAQSLAQRAGSVHAPVHRVYVPVEKNKMLCYMARGRKMRKLVSCTSFLCCSLHTSAQDGYTQIRTLGTFRYVHTSDVHRIVFLTLKHYYRNSVCTVAAWRLKKIKLPCRFVVCVWKILIFLVFLLRLKHKAPSVMCRRFVYT